jgi:arginyl-tRNA synthetase
LLRKAEEFVVSNLFVEAISEQVSQATGLEASVVRDLLETPPNPEMGDYALPCFTLAKTMHKAPNLIAEELSGQVETGETITEIRPTGPYLNFFVSKTDLVSGTMEKVLTQGDDYGRSNVGAKKTVVIDFSSPNIAKPFTIGHLRTTAIGNALVRIYEALGWKAVAINYLGDWGAPHGMNIASYKAWGEKDKVRKNLPYELFNLYVKFNAEVENDPSLKESAQEWTRKLESGDEAALTLWEWFREETIEDFKRVYRRMGINFTEFSGESLYHQSSSELLERLKTDGLATESEGALVVKYEDDLTPAVLQTSHGTIVYLPRDLCAATDRKARYDFDKMIYVVGAEQTLHFQQLFRTLKLMGNDWADTCSHVSFGLINFKGMKMSTRKGNVIFLEEVLDRAVEMTREIIEEKNPDLVNKEQVAEDVGIGAIIYADLDSRRIRDVVFDWEEILNFSGETGPYIQYTHARYCSVLRKYGQKIPPSDVDLTLLSEPEALAVVKCIEDFPARIEQAAENDEPSTISTYLIELCTVANRFYNAHRVVSEDEAITRTRVTLVYAIKVVLKNGLGLLGMKAPEKM